MPPLATAFQFGEAASSVRPTATPGNEFPHQSGSLETERIAAERIKMPWQSGLCKVSGRNALTTSSSSARHTCDTSCGGALVLFNLSAAIYEVLALTRLVEVLDVQWNEKAIA